LCGHFGSSVLNLDDITLINSNPGYDEIMLIKANADGNIVFGTTASGNNNDRCYRLTIDINDNVIISGGFGSTSVNFSSHVLYNTGSWDIFLVKYNNEGNILWAKSAQGSGADYGFSVTTDSESNIYTTGYYSSPIINFDDNYLNNNGDLDAYIAKYSPAGNILWVDGIGGVLEERGTGIGILNDSRLFISGQFESPSMVIDTMILFNNGNFDCFFIELDEEGNYIFAENFGEAYEDKGQALTTSYSGSVFIGGHFKSSSMNFGNHTIINTTPGFADLFVAEYGIPDIDIIADFDYESTNLTSKLY